MEETGLGEKIKAKIGELIDSGANLNVVKLARFVTNELGLKEHWFNYTHIEARNVLNEVKFKKVPYEDRTLFLPHCLKKPVGCKAINSEEGLICETDVQVCKDCPVFQIKKRADELGYKNAFIVPGGSMVAKLIEKYKPKAIVGIACYEELNLAMDKIRKYGLTGQGVMLSKAGCANTEVVLSEAFSKIELIDESSRTKKKEPVFDEKLVEKLK